MVFLLCGFPLKLCDYFLVKQNSKFVTAIGYFNLEIRMFCFNSFVKKYTSKNAESCICFYKISALAPRYRLLIFSCIVF